MQQFTPQAQQFIQDLAQRYGVSTDAAITVLYAVMNGGGTMAQFNHSELGGSGQWMQGGMTMVGDMFNYGLKSKVDGLCGEISSQLYNQPGYFQSPASQSANSGNSYVSPGQWWPGELGSPSSSGGQNNVRYAVFPGSCRLAVESNGQVTVYDTLNNSIGGVSQQQGSNDSLTFSSQFGTFGVSSLPVVSINGFAPQPLQTQPLVEQQYVETPVYVTPTYPAPTLPVAAPEDVFGKIERLADLRQKGVLTEQEFTTKKQELLSQI